MPNTTLARNSKKRKLFLTFPDEEILVAKRKHWLVIAPQIILTILLSLLFIVIVFAISRFLLFDYRLFVVGIGAFSVLALTFIMTTVINWYFHLYLITNHKLIELEYRPFFSEVISDVLLDQVRCTEVDVQTNGIINQFFNKGDVIITFDRPTHEEGFILSDVKYPRETGMFLSHALIPSHSGEMKAIQSWFRKKDNKREFQLLEEIVPVK